MAYFRNSIVNLLNLHYGIHALAMTGGGAFYAVYLLKSGVPLPGVLVAMAAILLGRFIIRPAIIPLTIRFGLRPLLIAGTLIGAMQYPVLAHVHGVGWTLLGLCALSSLGDTVYWSTYHAYFAALGDADHRGQQVSVREAITAVVGIISPLATGWVLVRYGANAAFGATAFAQTLAALPLLKTPNVAVMPRVPGVLKVALPAVLLFVGDGWIGAGLVFVWQLALFGVLHDSYLGFGGAMAIARPPYRCRARRAHGVDRAHRSCGHCRAPCRLARPSRTGGLRERARLRRHLSLHPGPDDGGLQSGQEIRLHLAFSCGD